MLDLYWCWGVDFEAIKNIVDNCVELKQLNLAGTNLSEKSIEYLVNNLTVKMEKLSLFHLSAVSDGYIKILVKRCNRLSALDLGLTSITDDSLTNIRECLNLTLEELSFGTAGFVYSRTLRNTNNGPISFTGFLELKPMPRLKILNLYYKKDDGKEIQNLRQHLPHLTVKGHFDC